ncbi:hypothetical protein GGI03_007731, partial [Coemansia sp. RSA 2337]
MAVAVTLAHRAQFVRRIVGDQAVLHSCKRQVQTQKQLEEVPRVTEWTPHVGGKKSGRNFIDRMRCTAIGGAG